MDNSIVYIVEDDQAVADALCCLFASVKLPCQHFANAQCFLTYYHSNININGCLLLDVRMPNISGFDLQAQLKQRSCQLPIIFITGHGDIAMAVRAMKAGAYDFITKPFNNQLLLEQVQRAINLTNQRNVNEHFKKNLTTLTSREQQILTLVISGKTSKEIAQELAITLSTVEMHRSKLMKKMQAKTIAELLKNYFLSKLSLGNSI